MVIAILLMLLITSVAIVGALYSSFLTFYATFGDTLEYNKAYYAATAGLERAELVLRYRAPGYEGSGGRLRESDTKDTNYGYSIDHRPEDFPFFKEKTDNGIVRKIVSKTTQIPKPGEGNVDWMLITGDSQNFNQLDYVNAENFIFYLDPGNGTGTTPYTEQFLLSGGVRGFTGIVRLPPLLRDDYKFDDLNDTSDDIGNDKIFDDAIVDWGFRGRYQNNPFQILPTTSELHTTFTVRKEEDSLIRESRINDEQKNQQPLAWQKTYSPFNNSSITGLTVLSANEPELKGLTFTQLLGTGKVSNLLFRISLLNLLTSINNQIYPYLEYQFSFLDENGYPTPISDRFYTITSQGKYGNYEVKLLVKKPTIQESTLWSFTVIF